MMPSVIGFLFVLFGAIGLVAMMVMISVGMFFGFSLVLVPILTFPPESEANIILSIMSVMFIWGVVFYKYEEEKRIRYLNAVLGRDREENPRENRNGPSTNL